MNTHLKPVSMKGTAEQVAINTTGWIGKLPGHPERIARGQTFLAKEEGDLQKIEVYSHIVSDPGKMVITLHDYDPQQRTWGPVLTSSELELKQTDCGKWIAFNMPEMHIDKGKFYGFKLQSKESYIGLGEAAGSAKQPPFNPGQEWEFNGENDKGDCFSYFSLAFKVALRA